MISPTGGTARVMGYVPWRRENAYRRRFALVMGQKNQLWWDLPAAESFRLHQQIYRIEPEQFDRTRDELTELLGVRDLLGQPVRELSLGERMKMELIAALLHSPDVLFLDEPTIGLDVVAQHNIQAFLKHYQQVRKSDDPADEPLHEGRGGALPPRGDHRPGADHLRRLAGGHHRPLRRAQDHLAADARRRDAGRIWSATARCSAPSRRGSSSASSAAWCPTCSRSILANHAVVDVSVEDPPLEEVIAEMFSQTKDEG